ncbi:hypothetical protein FCM35_KLT20930 [Carex littledalei]|uniref:Replication protein A 70 kDa DNA-binding subunit B/D first OB fold domain-containing protein n=1 Tax=Carex littledalei TaxID=544730 RepID=A0A833RE13_9POAL|nr:hypothetical protein FCM35_KLT20930 [Carex littledalei]
MPLQSKAGIYRAGGTGQEIKLSRGILVREILHSIQKRKQKECAKKFLTINAKYICRHVKIQAMGFLTVEKFAQLECLNYFWWDMNVVRVHFMMKTRRNNRLYLVLLDNDRAKMLAKVLDEMKSYVENKVRVGHLICLKDFKVEPAYQKYMTFAKCKVVERDFQIVFDKDTTILPLCQSICDFPLYPMVSSIETIYGIQHGNHLIDVVGRVCYGHKVEYLNSGGGYRVPALEIYLLDMTCNVIALVLMGLPLTNHVRLVRACHDKSIIFVTRVKVILHTPLNYLQATDISSVTFDPIMPEVFALKHRS